jgi:hypothetical protein
LALNVPATGAASDTVTSAANAASSLFGQVSPPGNSSGPDPLGAALPGLDPVGVAAPALDPSGAAGTGVAPEISPPDAITPPPVADPLHPAPISVEPALDPFGDGHGHDAAGDTFHAYTSDAFAPLIDAISSGHGAMAAAPLTGFAAALAFGGLTGIRFGGVISSFAGCYVPGSLSLLLAGGSQFANAGEGVLTHMVGGVSDANALAAIVAPGSGVLGTSKPGLFPPGRTLGGDFGNSLRLLKLVLLAMTVSLLAISALPDRVLRRGLLAALPNSVRSYAFVGAIGTFLGMTLVIFVP